MTDATVVAAVAAVADAAVAAAAVPAAYARPNSMLRAFERRFGRQNKKLEYDFWYELY